MIRFYYIFAFCISLFLLLGCNEADSGQAWYSLEEAQEKATVKNKKVLLTVYADNCSQSKQLRENVFPDTEVAEVMDRYFCSVRINADSKDSLVFNGVSQTKQEIAGKLGVTSYPTIVFLNSDGEKIIITSGFMKAETFANVLSFVGSDAYLTTEFDQFVDKQ